MQVQNFKLDCGVRKITRSPKVPNHEILGNQNLTIYEKSTGMSFQSLKDKTYM